MAAPIAKLSPEQYLQQERKAETKSEYWHGECFAMAGASFRHIAIQANIQLHVATRLAGPCHIYGSDLKVGIHGGKTGFAYPDATVICGPPDFTDAHHDVVTNPVAIFEVLSPGTERQDRGLKFREYRKLATLRHYVLVAQDSLTVEHFSRQPDGSWLLRVHEGGGLLACPDLNLEVPVTLFYTGLEDTYFSATNP